MNRYENGKIYKLVNNNDSEIYIGSTCLPLAKRLFHHKSKAKEAPDRKVYSHLNQVGWENVNIILIEAFPSDNKMGLQKKERHYIEQMKPSLNMYVPARTQEEYNQIRTHRWKAFKIKNKDKIKQRYTEVIECEICHVGVTRYHMNRHKKTKKHRYSVENIES